MGVDDNTLPVPPKGRPPAVLQIVPRLVSGGAERGTVELAGALAAAGWTSYVASGGGPLERDIIRSGATHLTLPLASKNPLRMRRNATVLARLIRRLGIDIIHARSRAPAWSAWSAADATGRHFVTTFHNAYDARLSLKRWYNSVMARGERVIAISQFVADHAAQVYGIGPDRLRTIPRGVDLDIFDPSRVGAERIAGLARRWRLPDGAPVVMLPARLTRWKGGLDFIAAINALGRHDICCVLVGPEQRRGFRRELEAAIKRGGLAGLFRIVEECHDMPAAYMLADVVVTLGGAGQGYSRAIVEAQAMGRPVVVEEGGGAAEAIEAGVTGWLAPAANPEALAEVLERALSLSTEQRARLARAAQQNIKAGFGLAEANSRLLQIYQGLAD